MLDLIFAVVAIAAGAQPPSGGAGEAPQSGVNDLTAALVAEDQTPTGRFTTATEVRPILGATRANWIAVREYGGNDLLYLSHLWGWRCGLAAISVGINDAPPQPMPLPDCHLDYASPNAILETDGLPYVSYPLGSVQSVTVEIVYDDLSREAATYERNQIRIP